MSSHSLLAVSLAVAALAGLKLAPDSAQSGLSQSGSFYEETDQVWTWISATGDGRGKDGVENSVIHLNADTTTAFGIAVRNGLNVPILNVTLVLIPSGIPLDLSLSQTVAEDRPQVTYALWRVIEPEADGHALVDVRVPAGAAGPFRIVAQVFFDFEDGERAASRTTIHGIVGSEDESGRLATPTAGVLVAWFVLAGVGFLRGRRR